MKPQTFLSGNRKHFTINQPVKTKDTIVSICKENNLLVDGDITSEDSDGKPLLILFQFKFKKIPSENKEDQMKVQDIPKRWYNCLSKIEKLKECKGITIIYVYFTNANIPKKSREATNIEKRVCNRLIVIDGSNAKKFFSNNIYPYFQPSNVIEGVEYNENGWNEEIMKRAIMKRLLKIMNIVRMKRLLKIMKRMRIKR